MPHNFIKLPPETLNPGPWTRQRLEQLCREHRCRLEHAWSEGGDGRISHAVVEYVEGTSDMRGLREHIPVEVGPDHPNPARAVEFYEVLDL